MFTVRMPTLVDLLSFINYYLLKLSVGFIKHCFAKIKFLMLLALSLKI